VVLAAEDFISVEVAIKRDTNSEFEKLATLSVSACVLVSVRLFGWSMLESTVV
jgi:hypothetical protein